MIKFTIPGKPRGKERPRVYHNTKIGRVIARTPDKTLYYENEIAWYCTQATNGEYYAGNEPIEVIVEGFYPIPSSWSKKKTQAAVEGRILPTVKVDLDNLCKAVLDALNGVAFDDDKQIVSLKCTKLYSTLPHVDVTILKCSPQRMAEIQRECEKAIIEQEGLYD